MNIYNKKNIALFLFISLMLILFIDKVPMWEFRFYKIIKLFFSSFPKPKLLTRIHFYRVDSILIILFFFLLKDLRLKKAFFNKYTYSLTLLIFYSIIPFLFTKTPLLIHELYDYINFILCSLIAFIIIRYLAKDDFKNFTIKIFYCLFITGTITAIVGILQYILHRPIGLDFLGEFNFIKGPSLRFHFNKNHWYLFNFFEKKFIQRSYGLWDHPNFQAGFLTISIFCSYYLNVIAKLKKHKLIISLCTIIQIIALFTTLSRAAIGSWFLYTAFWSYHLVKHRKFKKINYYFTTSYCLITLLFTPLVLSRTKPQLIQDHFNASRRIYLNKSQKIIKNHPFGIGYAKYEDEVKAYNKKNKITKKDYIPVHNMYLLIASEEGIIGLLLFIIFIVTIINNYLKIKKDLLSWTLFSMLLLILSIGFLDIYFISLRNEKILLFLITALLSVYIEKNQFSVSK